MISVVGAALVPGASALCLVALGLIAALPHVFFRPGRLNARWWLTALPFAVVGGVLAAGTLGWIEPMVPGASAAGIAFGWLAVPIAAAGIALIGYAVGSHARPVSLWHQEDDRPAHLATAGAYAQVRHPFYSAFLLVLLASALAFPHPLQVVALAGARVQLERTARREEGRLLGEFGERYAAYMDRTVRFWPAGLKLAARRYSSKIRGRL